jgi:hypothetical protein
VGIPSCSIKLWEIFRMGEKDIEAGLLVIQESSFHNSEEMSRDSKGGGKPA